VEICRRAQYDLVEFGAALSNLHAHRMRSAGRERHRGGLREPIGGVLPAPPPQALLALASVARLTSSPSEHVMAGIAGCAGSLIAGGQDGGAQ
jgi:hypothetical protein